MPLSGFQNRRVYPFGDLYAHSVGYVSFGRNSDGAELTYSDEILGRTAPSTDRVCPI